MVMFFTTRTGCGRSSVLTGHSAKAQRLLCSSFRCKRCNIITFVVNSRTDVHHEPLKEFGRTVPCVKRKVEHGQKIVHETKVTKLHERSALKLWRNILTYCPLVLLGGKSA
eukprot:6284593-Amphidinium_carterae.1